jgi:GNAT superfamily N-acetyltransferase
MPVEEVSDHHREVAVDLLARFFAEEGLSTPRARIAENLDRMRADPACWSAVAVIDQAPRAIVTVTTMLYIEWGRLAEIGDLYVLPQHRGQGLGRALIAAAIAWSRTGGCSGVYITLMPQSEARHSLSQFYGRLGFRPTGRTTMNLAFPAASE